MCFVDALIEAIQKENKIHRNVYSLGDRVAKWVSDSYDLWYVQDIGATAREITSAVPDHSVGVDLCKERRLRRVAKRHGLDVKSGGFLILERAPGVHVGELASEYMESAAVCWYEEVGRLIDEGIYPRDGDFLRNSMYDVDSKRFSLLDLDHWVRVDSVLIPYLHEALDAVNIVRCWEDHRQEMEAKVKGVLNRAPRELPKVPYRL